MTTPRSFWPRSPSVPGVNYIGGRRVTSITRQTSATVLPWAISCSAVLSLRMICSAVCLVRFMVGSPAQSGRLSTLIHPSPVSGVHVRLVGLACCTPNCSYSNYIVSQNRELSTKRCCGLRASPLFGISMSQPAVHYAKISNI